MRKVKLKSYEYIESLSENENQNQLRAREHSEKLGLAAISLSKAEAQILQFLLLNTGPKKVVEIGTLTGLTALYILEVLPEEACLWTLEKSEEHAQWAAEVLAHEIKKNRCKIIIGDAKEKLNELRNEGPFDAVFIDGNKAAYLDYFNWALENIKKDGIIVADNVFLAGAVWGDQTSQKFSEKQVRVVQEMNQLAFTNKNLKSIPV
jgi:predicted O-methyltransferase YrrM